MATDTNTVPAQAATATPLEGAALRGAVSGALHGDVGQTVVGAQQGPLHGVAADGEVIPVLREVLNVSKREVERGRVVIHKTVSEREEAAEILLRQVDVSVERVPVGRTVTEAPATRQEGDVTIVPILEEVLVVEKRLVLKEELHIRRTTTERMSHEVVRLRSETVAITPTGDVTVPHTAPIHEEH